MTNRDPRAARPPACRRSRRALDHRPALRGRRLPYAAIILLGAAGRFGLAEAQAQTPAEAPICEATSPMSPTRLLRRLSIDLRGRAPTLAELEAARDGELHPGAAIDAWVRSPEFVGVLRAHHERLLWPNLEQIELVPQNHVLFPYPRPSGHVTYVSPLRSVFVRASGPGYLYEPCLDEPARFDQDGHLVLEPLVVGSSTVAWLDGWVEVEPYWAPGTTIKVCALEAIESERAPVCPDDPERYPFIEPTCQNIDRTARQFDLPFRDSDVDCGGPLAVFAPGCGCGSDLRRCHTQETLARLRASFNEQALRIGDRVIEEGRPYHEMLTDRTVEVNGAIAHYLRHQSRLTLDLFADPDPDAPMASVPLGWADEAWRSLERTGRHSGVLTTPAYLMRHAAWRQRAHRFYDAFECSSFTPSGPLPSPFEPCSQREDLTERCGCADCHRTLEPMAAHWGRFAEFGFMNLDEARFPTRGLQLCRPPFESLEQLYNCTRLYELQPVGEEQAYLGYLNAYVFRSPDEQRNIAEGPRKLVGESVASGRFARCAVERMWTRFMHRGPTAEEAAQVLPELTRSFVDGGYDLRALVASITRLPAYGRAP